MPDDPLPMELAPLARATTTTSVSDGFAAFWSRYPRRVGKRNATRAYTAALTRTSHDELIAGLERHLPAWSQIDAQYIPHPSTWLNRDGWLDDPPPAPVRSRVEQRARLVGHIASIGRGSPVAAIGSVSAMFPQEPA